MLNRAAGPTFIESSADGLTITSALHSDVAALEEAVRVGELDNAVNRYTGDFFADFASPGADEFERWASVERARVRALFVHAAESLARRALDRGGFSDAITLARHVRHRAPHDETGWQLLLESLSASGDVIGARAEADHFDEWLRAEERAAEPASVAALRLARNLRAPAGEHTAPTELAADLVGRENEFSRLHDLWLIARSNGAHSKDAGTKRSRVALILGDGGIGKSRLAADLRTRIVAGRGRVVWCAARSGDRHVAYAALASLAAALASSPGAAGISQHSAAALLALDPALSSFFSGAPDGAQGDEALRRRGLAVVELIAAVADDAPFALVVDDLHWCDDDSLRAIAFVAARLSDERVLLVLTSRPTRALPPFGDSVTTVRLAPLTAEQVEQLVTSIAPLSTDPWARALPQLLLRCSAGVPLLVFEALRLAIEQQVLRLGGDDWQCCSEEDLDHTLQQGAVMGRRIGVLPPIEATVLRTIAAAELPIGADIISGATGLDAAHATAAAVDLERRALVASAGSVWRVAHDEIGAVAIALADPADLRATHRGLGDALAAQSGAGSHRRAVRHLVDAEAWDRVATVTRAVLADMPRRGPLDVELRSLLGDGVTTEQIADIRKALPAAIRLPLARRAALAAGVVAALSLGALAVARLGAHPAPETELLVAYVGDDGLTREVARTGITLERWNVGRPLDDAVREPRGAWTRTPSSEGATVIAPDGSHWATEAAFSDSGGLDVVLHDRTGAARRLTFSRGDDRPAAFSPDGALLAISTARWNQNGHSNLAVIDVRTGALVRRLTQGDGASVYIARWSPDGSRLAFLRAVAERDSVALCWTTVDAQRERCLDLAPWREFELIGFVGDSRVLLRGRSPTEMATLDVDLRTAAVSRTRIPADGNATLDAAGRWLLLSGHGNVSSDSMLIGPPLAFERARPVALRRIPGAHAVAWLESGPTDYIASVHIVHPRAPVSLGTPYRLNVTATTRTGKPTAPWIVLWRSLTPRVAAVDSNGVLVALDTGAAIIEASAGGWRSALDTVRVVRSASTLAADERWTDGVERRWRFFGEPFPLIVNDARGGRAFFNNGDSQFYSGAYSIAEYDATRGIAIEAEFSTPVTRTQWQMISVDLFGGAAFEPVAQWDHKTGYLPGRMGGQTSCQFVYPEGEGPSARTRANVARPLPRTLSGRPLELWRGAWHSVRVQMMPDGRCGYAIDGVAVGMGDSGSAPPPTARVVLQGMSVGTRMLIGHVRVFTGVPPGVDWSRAKRAP
ncbi:MAG TPA: AAA family ATPase [Gemmatimonadaceae bacterium]